MTTKKSSIFVLMILFLALTSGMGFPLAVDITGTWVGETEVPNELEPDIVTLVLSKEEGKYIGKVSDSMGMLQDTECENIVFEDNQLSLSFSVWTGEVSLDISMTLKVEGDVMEGIWEDSEGQSSGSVKLEKQK